MTAYELLTHLGKTYGINRAWPDKFEVDSTTYANCCQFAFERLDLNVAFPNGKFDIYSISLGKNKGLMFKNVELILKR